MLRRLIPVAAALALLVVGGSLGWAWATIPDTNGVIHGCRKTTDGTLKVIDTSVRDNCPSGYRALNWNQTGPAGPAGTSGWEVIRTQADSGLTDAGYWSASSAAHCPAGKVAVGGGYTYDNSGQTNPAEVKAVDNGFHNFQFLPGALPTAWQTTVEARVAGVLRVAVMCADA